MTSMNPLSNKRTLIHGHRGARGIYPENSLVAIQYALELGCDGIEVDLCVTRDDHLIVHHDPTLSSDLVRNSQGEWIDRNIRARDCSLREIREFDIGRIKPSTEYALRFDTQTPVDGTRIPTLEEFINTVTKYSDDVIFNIELKSSPIYSKCFPDVETYVGLVMNALLKHNIVHRCFLQSFDWRLMCAAKKQIPQLLTGFLTDMQRDGSPLSPVSGKPDMWSNYQDLADFEESVPGMIKSMGGDVWSSNYQDLTLQSVESAHDMGLEVYVWTVNEISDMERMIEWGVDTITTDYPDRLLELMA